MADTSNKNEERNEHGFEWPVVVRNSNPHANIDYYYGPYDSVESMKAGVPAEVLVPGFTAAVQTADGVTEYWVVSGSGDSATWAQKGLASGTSIGNGKLMIKEADSVSGGETIKNITTVFSANQSTDYTFDISSYAKLDNVTSVREYVNQLFTELYKLASLLEGSLILKDGKVYKLTGISDDVYGGALKETGVKVDTSAGSVTAKAFYETE